MAAGLGKGLVAVAVALAARQRQAAVRPRRLACQVINILLIKLLIASS